MKPAIRVLLLAGLLAAALDLHAVLMRPLSVKELSQNADLIVHGVVLNKSCHRDDAGRIYTKIELKVMELWKGTAPDARLTIFQGGGTVGRERVEVSGEAEYEIGEEVAAFLVLNPRRQPVTLALAQGKFHIWQDQRTGEKYAHNPFHGAPAPSHIIYGTAPDRAAGKPTGLLKLQELKQQAPGAKP